MKKTIIIIILLFTNLISAQCISGDCKNGFGKIQYQDAVYEGTFKNGNLEGIGIIQYTNGNYYFGQFISSKFTGFGYFQWKDGQNHFGKWENSLQNGKGIYNDAKANPTAGTWEKGVYKSNQNTEVQSNNPPNSIGNCINGYGRITYTDGSLIQAIFENGKAKLGRITKVNQYTYDGQIENSLPNGYGQIGYTNGDHYFGNFKEGFRQGLGILTKKDGSKTYGTWKNDKLLELNEVTFCNEIQKLTRLHISQVLTLPYEKNDLFTSEKTLKNKFLNVYQLTLKRAPFNDDYDLTITFPKSILNTPIVSKQKLNEVLTECNNLIKKEDFYFSFEDISISINEENYDNTITIRYPNKQ